MAKFSSQKIRSLALKKAGDKAKLARPKRQGNEYQRDRTPNDM